ncbi:MAG: hypothetical protein OCU12_08045 [Methanophagales archaeon]|nr:hypothetical protein [Methanophagales archaeon]
MSKLKVKKNKPKVFLAFDVENDPETGKFILAAVYGYVQSSNQKTLTPVQQTFKSQKGFQNFLMGLKDKDQKSQPCVLVGFNTAYDMGFLMEIEDTSKRLDAGGRFITTRLKNGIKVIDLSNFLVGSLESNVQLFKDEIPDIRKTALDVSDELGLEEHCFEDAKATYQITHYLDMYYREMGLELNLTKAGLALQSFQTERFIQRMEKSRPQDKRVRAKSLLWWQDGGIHKRRCS